MKYCPECKADLVLRMLDGVERKACAGGDCGFVAWDNPVPVVAGLILYQGKLLLARNRAWPAGVFSMITGYLERHEAPEAAIRRETREELGLEAGEVRFIGHYSFSEKNQLLMAFTVQAEGSICLNEELCEIELLDLQQLGQKDFSRLLMTAKIVGDWLGRAAPWRQPVI